MADTGSPWNIPYVEPTDIPRGYPQDSEDLANAIAAGLSAAGNAGIGSNVVSVTKTSTFTTTSASFVDVTGLAATITPTTNTSKILIVAQISVGSSSAGYFLLQGGNTSGYVGDAALANNVRSTVFDQGGVIGKTELTVVFLDSPATTAATTYKIQARRGTGGTVKVNQDPDSFNDADRGTAASSITLIEVAP
jgi:hypothetical protein